MIVLLRVWVESESTMIEQTIDALTPCIFGSFPSLVENRSSETGTYKCRSYIDKTLDVESRCFNFALSHNDQKTKNFGPV